MSSIPLGMLVFGWVIDAGGLRVAMLFSGWLLALTSIAVLFVPFLKHLASLDKQQLDGAYVAIFKDAFNN
jgi:hypothetical protein